MPYDLSHLDSNSATCTSALGIEVTYRLANVTPRVLRRMSVLGEQSDDASSLTGKADALVDALCNLVIAWDLTAHGAPIPLTRDALEDVRVEILGDVMTAIVEDASGNPQKGTPLRRR